MSSEQKHTAQEILLAEAASIICDASCGLTSQCRSREAAQALFDKGYLRSAASSQERIAQLEAALERMVALYESEYDADAPFVRPDWLRAMLAAAPERIVGAAK